MNREKSALVNNFLNIIRNLFDEQKIVSKAKLTVTIDPSIDWAKNANIVKINLYRIMQESFQNINKYAGATAILVNLYKDDKNIILQIIDNGVGFQVTKKSKGIGIQNMEARVAACHGTFELNSKVGEGTTLQITIPIEKNKLIAS